jgi:hypothetical protein
MCTDFYHLIVFALAESDLLAPRHKVRAGKENMGLTAAFARPPFPNPCENKREGALS